MIIYKQICRTVYSSQQKVLTWHSGLYWLIFATSLCDLYIIVHYVFLFKLKVQIFSMLGFKSHVSIISKFHNVRNFQLQNVVLGTTKGRYLSVCMSVRLGPLDFLPFTQKIFRQSIPENLLPYPIFFYGCQYEKKTKS